MCEQGISYKYAAYFLVLLVFNSFALANTIIYVDDDAAGANDGSSWQNAYIYLQDALADANSAEKPVEIHVAQGIYKPDVGTGQTTGDRNATFELINNVTLSGGYAGIFELNPNARDIELYQTILSGDLDGNDLDVNEPEDLFDEPTRAENSFHVVTGNGTNETAELDGFIITGGNANTGDYLSPLNIIGGGMYNRSGVPILMNCTFFANSANSCGGGMYNDQSNPVLNGCTFSNNAAGFGGGMYSDQSNPVLNDCTFSENVTHFFGGGIYSIRSYLILNNCNIKGNKVLLFSELGNDGGGLYNYESDLILNNCIFKENYAPVGGGISSMGGGSSMNLTNCTFIENAGHIYGGGIYGGNLNLTNCAFIENTVHYYGGGIYGGNINLSNCVIRGNIAQDGAGICNSGNEPNISNCIFAGNYANRNGGGIFTQNSDPILMNCTFTENRADNGSSIACGSHSSKISESNVELINCIVWDSNNAIWIDDDSVVNASYSNIKGGWEGTGNIDIDPLFANPGYWADINDSNIIVEPNDANAIWIDGDYHLKSQAGRFEPNSQTWVQDDVTSPCIDAGDPNGPIGYEPFPNGGYINMGAYGGTSEASKTYFGEPLCETIFAGDINGDCKVDELDLEILMLHWLQEY